MNRPIVAALLVPFVAISLLACGSDDGDNGENALFQGYAGTSGGRSLVGRDDQEAPLTDDDPNNDPNDDPNNDGNNDPNNDPGAAGTAGSSGKGGSFGKAGSSGKGGAAGSSGKGGSAGKGGSSGASGKGGASGSAGKDGSSGKGGTSGSSGKGGTSGSSGNGGSSAAGTGGSTSTPPTSPYEGAIVPSTCDEAHGTVGCCGPDNRAYFIGDDGTVKISTCKNGQVCGWNASTQWYGCTDSVGTDPTGTYPLLCGGEPVAGACETTPVPDPGSGGSGGSSSGPAPGSQGAPCTASYYCLPGLYCSAGMCTSSSGSGSGSGSGNSCQSKGGYGGLGCTGIFLQGCQQIGCGCCESGGVGQCC